MYSIGLNFSLSASITIEGFDTVVMNPPFGTRTVGIDTVFVRQVRIEIIASVY